MDRLPEGKIDEQNLTKDQIVAELEETRSFGSLIASPRKILCLQSALKMLGFDPGKLDGVYRLKKHREATVGKKGRGRVEAVLASGSRTERAVLKFQQENGLHADGIAGKKTIPAIIKSLSENQASVVISRPGVVEKANLMRATEEATRRKGEDLAEDLTSGIRPLDEKPVYSEGQEVSSGLRVLKNTIDSAAINIIHGFNSKDNFVHFRDNYYKKNFKLRETTCKCLQLARKFAQADGYDIMVNSAYRRMDEQVKLFDKSGRRRRRAAPPGGSWHHSGAATDCYLVKKDNPVAEELETPEELAKLEFYMNKAGFVRYKEEPWHFEVGSTDWLKIMVKIGVLPRAYARGTPCYEKLTT